MFIPQPQDRPVRNPKGGSWSQGTWDPSTTMIHQAQLLLRVIFLMVLNIGQRLQRRSATHIITCMIAGSLVCGVLAAELHLMSKLGMGKKMEVVAYLAIDQATRLLTHWLDKRAQGRALKRWELSLSLMGSVVGLASTLGATWRLLGLLLDMVVSKFSEMW